MNKAFEKIMESLEEETYCPNCSIYCVDSDICGFEEMKKQAKQIVQEAEKYNNGWIPVSERFPKEFDTVLVTMADDCKGFSHMQGSLDIGYLDNRIGFVGACDTYSIDDIIAWQPLPQPYHPKGE